MRDLVRRPARKASASEPDIVPVHAGLFDAEANPLLASFVGTLPSMRGALAAIRAFFKDNWQPGDVALTNDMDAGAVNACEIIAAAPIFSGKVLIGWSVVRGRVPDFGGWEPGGYSPQAVDRWAEGARLEPVKVMLRGSWRREVNDLVRLNSRTPATTLRHVSLLVEATNELGQAYAQRTNSLHAQVSTLRRAEREQVRTAFAQLPEACPPQRIEIVARWLNRQFGSIDVVVARSEAGLHVALSGPPIAGCPINLGRDAAQDIVTALIAGACRLDDVVTDALSTQIQVSLQGPSLLCATLPATVGIGRQVSGQVLARAIAMSLGLSAARAEAVWQHYRDTACGVGFDPDTGKLATSNAARIRERQLKEIAA